MESQDRRLHLSGVRLHSDNGNPMKGATMLTTLYNLGVIPSFSRPRVSDDNPHSESLFKTLKYTAGYPKYLRDLSHAREWMAAFVDWYNIEQLHPGIGYVTPLQRHEGTAEVILDTRNRTLEQPTVCTPSDGAGDRKSGRLPRLSTSIHRSRRSGRQVRTSHEFQRTMRHLS
jgi:putative transposase